jgi:hypothetical protein
MSRPRSSVAPLAVVVCLALSWGSPSPKAEAQAPPSEPAPPTKSVRGTLLSVDTALNSVIMTETGGEKMAWHFEPAIVAEAARFKPGDPVIVIYRQISPKLKRVTALAFPGSAKSPIYVNLTGERVVIRSVAGVDGACETTSGAVSESTIPVGGLADIMDGCWCCAPVGSTCTPGTKSGLGRAFLAQCFR